MVVRPAIRMAVALTNAVDGFGDDHDEDANIMKRPAAETEDVGPPQPTTGESAPKPEKPPSNQSGERIIRAGKAYFNLFIIALNFEGGGGAMLLSRSLQKRLILRTIIN